MRYLVVVSAKSITPLSDLAKLAPFPPDPNSSDSTITTVAREIVEAGGEAMAVRVDTTSYESIKQLIAATISVSWGLFFFTGRTKSNAQKRNTTA